jgi:hypothetical protein
MTTKVPSGPCASMDIARVAKMAARGKCMPRWVELIRFESESGEQYVLVIEKCLAISAFSNFRAVTEYLCITSYATPNR